MKKKASTKLPTYNQTILLLKANVARLLRKWNEQKASENAVAGGCKAINTYGTGVGWCWRAVYILYTYGYLLLFVITSSIYELLNQKEATWRKLKKDKLPLHPSFRPNGTYLHTIPYIRGGHMGGKELKLVPWNMGGVFGNRLVGQGCRKSIGVGTGGGGSMPLPTCWPFFKYSLLPENQNQEQHSIRRGERSPNMLTFFLYGGYFCLNLGYPG